MTPVLPLSRAERSRTVMITNAEKKKTFVYELALLLRDIAIRRSNLLE